MIKTAMVLAAGRGVRLGEYGRLRPKGLIELGGTTLMARSLALLTAAGIERILIITGHCAPQYEALADRWGHDVRCLFNPDFAVSGSLASLLAGAEAVDGPLLVLESDIIYEPRAVSVLIEHPSENVLLVSGPTGAGDEVYVWAQEEDGGHQLTGISKDCAFRREEPFGELVGITKIGPALWRDLVEQGRALVTTDPMADYEMGLLAAASSARLEVARVHDLVWAEIDDVVMMERARRAVLPRLDA